MTMLRNYLLLCMFSIRRLMWLKPDRIAMFGYAHVPWMSKRQVMIKEFHARHIMIQINELVTPRLAMDQIIDIKRQLDDGADFAELAREHSDDTTSANLGGDMGWFPPEAFGDRIKMTLSALQPGQVSEPFQTTGGWHIMELLGTRDTDRTEEAIRSEARDKIMMRKADQEIEKVLRQFRDEAYVEIRLAGHQGG